MSLSFSTVGTLLATELRLLLRDRRTVVVSILLPILITPLLLFAGRLMEERRSRRMEATRFTALVTGTHTEVAQRLLAAVQRASRGGAKLTIEEKRGPANPGAALADGSLDVWLQALAPGELPDLPPLSAPTDESALEEDEHAATGAPVIYLVFRGDRDRSSEAAQRLADRLRLVREVERHALLADAGLPVPPEALVRVEQRDVASAEQVTGLQVGRLITVFFLIFVLSGGAVVATDTLAGEKERGTLETLLTTAAGRREIIFAKLLAILIVAVTITAIQALNFLAYVVFRLVPLPAGFSLELAPTTALAVLAMLLPVAGVVTSALLLTSGIADSYKEAQLYFFPTFLLTLAPSLAAFLPGVELRSPLALVPIAGVAVGVKEILAGTAEFPMLVLTWLVTFGAAVGIALAAERTLSTERLIAPATAVYTAELSPQLFQRHVLRIFALLWAFLFIVSLNLEGKLDLRAATALNLVGIFLGGTLFLVRRYRLNPREALALRPVPWPVWIAVALGAPAGLLTGVAVFRLANLVIPVPPEVLESFSKALLPSSLPLWQAFFFLAALPAVCEELTFRGLLLYGLHRRLHPTLVALVTGLVFAGFHGALFRLVPVTYLGVLLATVTLLTGSVLPAMAWHAINNALALVAAHQGAPLESASAAVYGLAVVLLLVSAAILWRVRTPYPNLRWQR